MQGELVKLCPRCGSEFQMKVESCLDCGATLVIGVEGQGAADMPEAGRAEELPVVPRDAVRLRAAPPVWIGRLSEDLDDAGIRHWVSPPEWRRDPSLFVLPSDLEAALRIDQERYAMEMPDVRGEEPRPQRTARPSRRGPSDQLDLKVCPSCGGEYQLWAEKCADCGVPLVRPWDVESAPRIEPQVLAPVPVPSDDPGHCPACGERIAEGAPECPGCGLMLAQPDACPNCGVELEPHVASCRRCGFEFFGIPEG